jgi:protein TonB
VFLTLCSFLVLPLIQAITEQPEPDTLLQPMDVASLPPPPAPEEPEPEPEPEPEEQPPELLEEAEPLDLSQLELALDPGLGGAGWMGADFAVKLDTAASSGGDVDALFALSDLDQQPRVTYQPMPVLSKQMRKKAPGTVKLIFIVDSRGQVVNPRVQSSSDPIFEKAALAALKKWRFEPGKRGGRAVSSRMRIPITFPGD